MREYKIIRSKRKTIEIQIKNGIVIVRAPYNISDRELNIFLDKHDKWIKAHLKKVIEEDKKFKNIKPISTNNLNELTKQAKLYIPQRVEHYAEKAELLYSKITIRHQRTRWGSCSSNGNLSFNCLLMLTPKEVIDSVVVHELCHLKEMNHSKKFYKEVLKIYPDYWKWNQWLKENGKYLICR